MKTKWEDNGEKLHWKFYTTYQLKGSEHLLCAAEFLFPLVLGIAVGFILLK